MSRDSSIDLSLALNVVKLFYESVLDSYGDWYMCSSKAAAIAQCIIVVFKVWYPTSYYERTPSPPIRKETGKRESLSLTSGPNAFGTTNWRHCRNYVLLNGGLTIL